MSARALFFVVALSAGLTLATTPAQAEPPASADPKAEAQSHFDLAVSHFDREEWSAALVEFLKSRELFPSKGNTKNAAICLRKVGRFDEALDMFEALLREFPELSPPDRALAEREVRELQASVATLDVRDAPAGAAVTIDSIERGKMPLKGPIRLAAGSHNVRVSMDGTLPFEARVDLTGRQAAVVHAALAALTQAGRLRILEHGGKALDVVIDGAVVGRTPWEGALAPGPHTALLRGEGKVGTPPESVTVTLDQVASLDLIAQELPGELRVEPKPLAGAVSIDGVPVGRGPWEGRLRAGPHQVRVTGDGYLPFAKNVSLDADKKEIVLAALSRDPSAFGRASAALGLELDGAVPIGALFGGDVATTCTGTCAPSLPVGVHGVLHGIYQAASGFGGGVDVGYLLASRSVTGRATTIQPLNRPINPGTSDDKLQLSGLTVGASAQFRTGERWSVLGRFGAGVLFGRMSDQRSGSFQNSKSETYTVNLQKSASATYLYFAPELRIGRRFGEHFELNAGVAVMIMTALSQPKWKDDTRILTTNNPATQGDGQGTFGDNTLLGSFVLFVVPGIGARYDF